MSARMTAQMLLLVTILRVISFTLSSKETNTYCVGDSTLNNCPEECKPFQEVVKIMQNNSIVLFCSGKININSLVTVDNFSNITLQGNNSVLSCTENGTGLLVVSSSRLTLMNMVIENCGSSYDSTTQSDTNETVHLSSAVYVINCSYFMLEAVQIVNSHGFGLVLYDTNGLVEIQNSRFYNNSLKHNDSTYGGGGVYVEFTVCTPGVNCTEFDSQEINARTSNNTYIFKNCTFQYNAAYLEGSKFMKYTKDGRRESHQGLGRGGGLSIQVNGKAEHNVFTIEYCTFQQNKANWGGGLYIVIQDSSSHNIIQLNQVMVEENGAKQFYGGGGIYLGFNIATASNNSAHFDQCRFAGNTASYGGGVRIYSSRSDKKEFTNTIEFSNCNWTNNTARFGSAIDIAPHVWEVLSSGFLPEPKFHNCEFTSNNAKAIQNRSEHTMGYREYENGRGALMLTKFEVIFSGSITFKNNVGSAIYLASSIIHTETHTTCRFVGNYGFEGGAIAFVGFSALFVEKNTLFQFASNKAMRKGGAMFAYNIDKHDFVSSRSCFIQYSGSINSKENKNVTFVFSNNFAGYASSNRSDCYASGHSVYSSSLLTCVHACENHDLISNTEHSIHGPEETFACVGDFKFLDNDDLNCEISTSGHKFYASHFSLQNNSLQLFPGREIDLNISVVNDFNRTIDAVYYATIKHQNNSNIKIDQPYSYISNHKVKLHGSPGSKGVLNLQKLGYREIALDVNVLLIECPPGYVLDKTNEVTTEGIILERCVCSTLQTQTSFKPIEGCNNTIFRASLNKGYWLGYIENHLAYSYCPSAYCANRFNMTSLLPQSGKLLDDEVCGKFRTGILCGQCKPQYSVHYHGVNFQCESNDSCNYGWLLYILSELLPVTFLFIITIVFNISFASGVANGFIWFAQVIDAFPITGKSFIIFPEPVYFLYTIVRMIYSIFNFDFFRDNKLSFCLWRGATTMDMLVFKFVTVVYALVLVVITVALVKYCNIFQRCKCLRFSTVKASIIHGLSSVLVIVFSQCFKVSCQILEATYIYGEGNKYLTTVVYLQGDLTPFTGGHIKYSLLAVFCIIVMIVPMMLLLIYPFTFKVLKLLKCSDDNRAARNLCHLPYSKLKPFLDSFQSCFKDNYRVFAGLYFVYRALIIFTLLVPTLTQRYVTLDSFLVVFLLIHAIAQPYQKRVHNIIDGLVFFNLIVINKITTFEYSYSKKRNLGSDPLPITTTLTVILLSLPLFFIIIYILVRIISKVKGSITNCSPSVVQNGNYDEFELSNRDEESDSEDSCDYQPFGRSPLIMDPYPT